MLKPSASWAEELRVNEGIVVLDPDGWDRQNFSYSWYEERITKEEFDKRLRTSTTMNVQQEYVRCSSISQQG